MMSHAVHFSGASRILEPARQVAFHSARSSSMEVSLLRVLIAGKLVRTANKVLISRVTAQVLSLRSTFPITVFTNPRSLPGQKMVRV
jgi:hypothetical protein